MGLDYRATNSAGI